MKKMKYIDQPKFKGTVMHDLFQHGGSSHLLAYYQLITWSGPHPFPTYTICPICLFNNYDEDELRRLLVCRWGKTESDAKSTSIAMSFASHDFVSDQNVDYSCCINCGNAKLIQRNADGIIKVYSSCPLPYTATRLNEMAALLNDYVCISDPEDTLENEENIELFEGSRLLLANMYGDKYSRKEWKVDRANQSSCTCCKCGNNH